MKDRILENTPVLTCPYCDYEMADAMEGNGICGDGWKKIKCPECDDVFWLARCTTSYSFDTSTLSPEMDKTAKENGHYLTID